MQPPNRAPRPRRTGRLALAAAAIAVWVALPGGPASAAEDNVDSVFGELGTSSRVAGDEAPPDLAAGEGVIRGRVVDAQAGTPIQGVSVIVKWPEDGAEPRQDVRVTDLYGEFEFAVPAGRYTLSFVKSGYRASSMTGFEVAEGQVGRADFPMPPLPSAGSDQVLELDAFVVEASTVDEMMNALELRLDSDLQLNIMSAEDFSKFASSDVADALKRVAGVNVVEGQFAIIRGLEDRYSSTLYNSAVVPSPDPDRQSVQLDLFPTEVVDNLVVAKTFGPELPSNSSGGSIDIVTHQYPEEEFTFKLKGAFGFNENALDEILGFQNGSSVGDLRDGPRALGPESGFFVGGRSELFEREVRYKAVFNWELGYDSAFGYQETREPRRAQILSENFAAERVIRTGGLAFGELALSGGRFDLTESQRSEQTTYYGGLGFDLDEEGQHQIDLSVFYTEKSEETVQLRDNGYLPNFDYSSITDPGEIDPSIWICCAIRPSYIVDVRDRPPDSIEREGALWFSYFADSRSFLRERDLLVTQINGGHRLDLLDGLHWTWAGNYATTTQHDDSKRLQYWYEPNCASTEFLPPGCVPDSFPATLAELGPGRFVGTDRALGRINDIDETQWFARTDLDQEFQVTEWLGFTVATGGWYELAQRDVDSQSLATPFGEVFFFGASPLDINAASFFNGLPLPDSVTNESEREIWAWSLHSKATFWDRVDLLGGFRLENVTIESKNDPFTGGSDAVGVATTFPSRYLMFDRRDNPNRPLETPTAPPFTVFNDQLLGIPVPVDFSTAVCNRFDPQTGTTDVRGCVDVTNESLQQLLTGVIDERKILPAVGFAVRPIEGLTVRGAWSRTVARPSFREMGFYVSTEPGSDDSVIGNPQMKLSEVESYDLRAEYVWGEGDLVAASGFYKLIDDPIESIILRDPSDFTDSSNAQFRTFFNNPNQADLWGIEVEARKNLGFVPVPLLEYFSLGGNFTWIDASVARTQGELGRIEPFFARCLAGAPGCSLPGDAAIATGLAPERRLFGQPEWIANADVTFDHPDWGSSATLAYFAISDVLDAAGGPTFISPQGLVERYSIDRYVDSFYSLDLVLSQDWDPEFLPGAFSFKFRIKNLTDSTRRIIYDPDVTVGTVVERSVKVGRDYKFSFSYSF